MERKRDIRKWKELCIRTGQSLCLHGIRVRRGHPFSTFLISSDLLPLSPSLLPFSHPSPLLPLCISLLPPSDLSPHKAAKFVQWLI